MQTILPSLEVLYHVSITIRNIPRVIWESAHNYLQPLPQAKQNAHNQAKLQGSVVSHCRKTGGKHSKEMKLLKRKIETYMKQRRKQAAPLQPNPFPTPNLCQPLICSPSFYRMSSEWNFEVYNLLKLESFTAIIPLTFVHVFCIYQSFVSFYC